jgi:hypothetical protein
LGIADPTKGISFRTLHRRLGGPHSGHRGTVAPGSGSGFGRPDDGGMHRPLAGDGPGRALGRSESSSSAILRHRQSSVPVHRRRDRARRRSRGTISSSCPRESEIVHVLNVGRRALRHNGQVTTDCLVRAGDVLYIEDVAVLVADAWPCAFDRRVAAVADAGFPFGAPDLDGIVGETISATANHP